MESHTFPAARADTDSVSAILDKGDAIHRELLRNLKNIISSQDIIFHTLVIRHMATVNTKIDSDTRHLSLALLKNGGNIRIPGHRSVVTRKYSSKEGAVKQSGSGCNEEVPLGGHGSCSIGGSGSRPSGVE